MDTRIDSEHRVAREVDLQKALDSLFVEARRASANDLSTRNYARLFFRVATRPRTFVRVSCIVVTQPWSLNIPWWWSFIRYELGRATFLVAAQIPDNMILTEYLPVVFLVSLIFYIFAIKGPGLSWPDWSSLICSWNTITSRRLR